MATILKNILSFSALAVGVPSVQAHLININGIAIIPRILAANAQGFTITANATNVTVTRLEGAASSVKVYCEGWHSIENAQPLPSGISASDFPFIIAAGGIGGVNVQQDEATVLTTNTISFVGSTEDPIGLDVEDLGNGTASLNATLGMTNVSNTQGSPTVDIDPHKVWGAFLVNTGADGTIAPFRLPLATTSSPNRKLEIAVVADSVTAKRVSVLVPDLISGSTTYTSNARGNVLKFMSFLGKWYLISNNGFT